MGKDYVEWILFDIYVKNNILTFGNLIIDENKSGKGYNFCEENIRLFAYFWCKKSLFSSNSVVIENF